ncbi:MAG: TonB-dependent receptor [Porphyromonas sp.]|nr:TonB-dependent receptor [Porphyromonas sp.]
MKQIKLLLCLLGIVLFTATHTSTAYAQNSPERNIKTRGIVVDETGEPLIGVSVYIKTDKSQGVASNLDGEFTLMAAPGEIIVFSMLGFEPFEHTVRQRDTGRPLRIVLEEARGELDEVVVTGLTTQKKVSVVGAITNVDVAQLQTPSVSITNMLGGKVAGVITTQLSGEPGRNISNFWIRGIGTFGANAGALVLIDGLEGNLALLDPDDIESFSILKDAAATAVYGVRGANGVVVVTTKKGRSGELTIRARATVQYNRLKRLPVFLESYDYAMLANEARAMDGLSEVYTDMELELIKNNLDPDLYPNVDWMSEVLSNHSISHRYYASASGGGDVARYFLSLGSSFQGAAYKQDQASFKQPLAYNQHTYRANVSMNLTPQTIIDFSADGAFTYHALPGFQDTNSLWRSVLNITPLMFPVKYSDGTLPTWGMSDLSSPYAQLNYTGLAERTNFRNKLVLQLTHNFRSGPLEGLSLNALGTFELFNNATEARSKSPNYYRATGRNANGELIKSLRLKQQNVSYSRNTNFARKYYFESKANYNRNFDGHNIGALLYYYMEDYKSSTWALDNLGINGISERRQNISGRLSYGYNNTYFIDANFGYTGSSQFRSGERWGFFPSIAIGWVPSSYEWMEQHMPIVSFLKIRASYGTAGNDKISNVRFPYLTIINNHAGVGWGYAGQGITEQQVGADNLKWEIAKKANAGIEANFLDNRLKFVVDFFHDQRDNIYQQRATLPEYLGLVNLPYSNVGRMHSFGSDGNVEYTYPIKEDMSFTLRANYTWSQNIVDNWEENKQMYDYLNYTGKPLNVFRGYISEGLFETQREIDLSPDQSQFGRIRPGDIKYRDVNGDGVINDDDKVPISYSNQLPRLMGGFGGSFTYKEFTVGLLFRASALVEYYRAGAGYDAGWIPFLGGESGNVLAFAKNPKYRWIPEWYSGDASTENPNAELPRLSYGHNTNNTQPSTFWKRDGSYIRLQEISARYHLGKRGFMKHTGLSSIDFELVLNNVFTIDKVKYFDPEQAMYNGAAYPIPFSVTFQTYLNF